MKKIIGVQECLDITQARDNFWALKNLYSRSEGIVVGLDSTGQYLIQIYWSSDEVSVKTRTPPKELIEERFVMTQKRVPWGKEKDKNGRVFGTLYLVGNGDQIFDALSRNTLKETMYNWDYKTNPPLFTPRITALCTSFLSHHNDPFKVEISVIKRKNNGDCARSFYYPSMYPGLGTCIMTCTDDKNPKSLTQCEPFTILLPEERYIIAFTQKFWAALNEKGRISLVVKYIDIHTNGIILEIENNPLVMQNEENLSGGLMENSITF